MSAWSHLPNSHHIDWVLKSVKERQDLWVASWPVASNAVWDAVSDAACDAARVAARVAARAAARAASWVAARDAARAAAWDVIAALIAYDDCDQFLSMSYERLKVWAVLSEDPRAVLLLPMVYVKEKLNECMVTSA